MGELGTVIFLFSTIFMVNSITRLLRALYWILKYYGFYY